MSLRGSVGAFVDPSATTVTLNVVSIGIQQNDIVLLRIDAGGSGSLTPTFPSGFAAVPGLSNQNVNGGTHSIAYKVAGASEPSTYVITPGNTTLMAGECRVYSGRNTSAPFTAVAATAPASVALPGNYVATGVTAASGDDVVLCIAVEGPNSGDTLAFTAPSGFANSLKTSNNGLFDPTLFSCDHVNVTSGATGSLTTAVSDTSNKTLTWAAYTLSLAAAGSSVAVNVSNNFRRRRVVQI